MTFSTHTFWRTILFSVIFIVAVFGVFGIKHNTALAITAQQYCSEKFSDTYGALAVSEGACDASTQGVASCESIPSSYNDGRGGTFSVTGYEGMVCRITSDAAGNAEPPAGTDGSGPIKESLNFIGGISLSVVNMALNAVAWLLLNIASLILGISGVLLNKSIDYTIVANNIAGLEAIVVGWGTIRDIANILFIFIMLYIAIATILRIQQFSAKNLLIKVVIAALLVNFSLFFTRVVIDTSNIATKTFYDQLISIDTSNNTNTSIGSLGSGEDTIKVNSVGISGAFMDSMGLASIFEIDFSDTDEFKTVVFQVMGAIFILIAAFAFALVAMLLIIRFILFIILMVTSPIGFIGGLLPKLGGMSGRWWKTLWDQALFAPAFMLLAFLSFNIIKEVTGGGTGSFTEAFGGGSVDVVLSFIIASGFLIASVLIAKSLASSGSGSLVSSATKLSGRLAFGTAALAGRQTARVGAFTADKTGATRFLKQKEAEGSGAARLALRGGRALGTSSFDARNLNVLKNKPVGIDLGKGGTGGFIDRQEAAEKKKKKENQDRIKKVGVATEFTQNQFEEAQSVLRNKKSAYAQAQTTEERKQAQTELDAAQKTFFSINAQREAEIQDSRSRIARHEFDSRLGGIWTYMTGGAGAVRGRKQGLESAEGSAVQERDKMLLVSTKQNLEDFEQIVKGITENTQTLPQAITKLEKQIKKTEDDIENMKPSDKNAGSERIRLNSEAARLKTQLKILEDARRHGGEVIEDEINRLEAAKKSGEKKKEKDDFTSAFKKGIDEQNKSGGSNSNPGGGNKSGGSNSNPGAGTGGGGTP